MYGFIFYEILVMKVVRFFCLFKTNPHFVFILYRIIVWKQMWVFFVHLRRNQLFSQNVWSGVLQYQAHIITIQTTHCTPAKLANNQNHAWSEGGWRLTSVQVVSSLPNRRLSAEPQPTCQRLHNTRPPHGHTVS